MHDACICVVLCVGPERGHSLVLDKSAAAFAVHQASGALRLCPSLLRLHLCNSAQTGVCRHAVCGRELSSIQHRPDYTCSEQQWVASVCYLFRRLSFGVCAARQPQLLLCCWCCCCGAAQRGGAFAPSLAAPQPVHGRVRLRRSAVLRSAATQPLEVGR